MHIPDLRAYTPVMCRPLTMLCLSVLAAVGTAAAIGWTAPSEAVHDRLALAAGRPALSEAPQPERDVLHAMLRHESWSRRVVAVLRLERYGCQESAGLLTRALSDPVWQVRAFALRGLIRRGESVDPQLLLDETEPRVIRTALRYRVGFDSARLARGVRLLARSSSLEDKMLAVELASASGDAELVNLARETCRTVILRLDRVHGGVLSPRLAAVTGQRDLRRHLEWQQWLLKVGRRFEVAPSYAVPADAEQLPPSLIAQLESEAFVGIESYMNTLAQRNLDLAILIDCTASMHNEISAAQGGIDDMMRFASDIVSSARIAIVGYRDKKDQWETKHSDFTDDLARARSFLWTLTAEGGGDHPEAVYPAIRVAFTQLTWRKESSKVLVLVGDAPPHVGYGSQCVDMARRARDTAEVTTHVIQAKGKEVKHFPDIAKAGGGRCVNLDDDALLMAEIVGLSLADRYEHEFREFFQVYLELCR